MCWEGWLTWEARKNEPLPLLRKGVRRVNVLLGQVWKMQNSGDGMSAYRESDIGSMKTVVVEGIEYMDEIIGVWLPDNQYVIGPRLKCAHLFARFSMVPAMLATSDAIKDSMEGNA